MPQSVNWQAQRYARLSEHVTPQYWRDVYLKDVKLVDADSKPWDDRVYIGHLRAAIAEFERETQIPVLQEQIVDEPHDYSADDYCNFAWMQLFKYPVVSVDRIVARYPTGQVITEYPKEWVKLQKEHGQFQMVPTAGTLSQVMIGQGGTYLPLVFNHLTKLPHLWYITYTIGLDPERVPWDIVDCIMKLACCQLLPVAADTIVPPGVASQSLGVDGLSQSTSYLNNGQLPPVFTGRIKLYRAELYGGSGVGDIGQQGKLASLRDAHRGIKMVVA